MMFDLVLPLVVSAGLLVYLVIALLRPEKF
ncbi:MAG: K(+)-transporting ATPase subunit F [Vicinamibacterales bacterium]|jgi:K+-transporting ATPase KdpF subunit|nr:K(+)-transporting ATPase subunit F [Vicinamibacterales bacterium]